MIFEFMRFFVPHAIYKVKIGGYLLRFALCVSAMGDAPQTVRP